MQPPEQQQQQQHPFSYIFVGRRTFYLFSSIKDIVRLRATCTWLRDLFGEAQLRDRLRHSLGSQAGLRRAVNGQQVQLLRFDDDQFGTHDLLAAAYVSAPRVLAQLKMVARHLHFSDDSCLQLFQNGNGEHRQAHDPPVRESIYYRGHDGRWVSIGGGQETDASVSSLAKYMVLSHFSATHQTDDTLITLNRFVGGGRLDGLLTDSPHTPVAGCTTTLGLNVDVFVFTTEAPLCEGGPFKHRFPVTTRLARVALGAVASYVFDTQMPTMVTIWMRAAQMPQLRRRAATDRSISQYWWEGLFSGCRLSSSL
ncbi:unnamed protein product [Vitrella brassicaformis CCMP3155]|uniref:Uncharacterized protein n=1 Tax=Vitrella brassicaformis (strain CCMP3155) TaxID=1169540 RepID=A0A0G4GCI5_VITBC|nr:unnamed protein product [Vitrella brassicaformis CCMP3155]|eukprot:CEM26503.1 unnamed protein product [Vitrella brassicaformis CCMP3155]